MLTPADVAALATINLTPEAYEVVKLEFITELGRGLDGLGRPKKKLPFPHPGPMAVEVLARHGLVKTRFRNGEHVFQTTADGQVFIEVFMRDTAPEVQP
jgi:hypothetical protein